MSSTSKSIPVSTSNRLERPANGNGTNRQERTHSKTIRWIETAGLPVSLHSTIFDLLNSMDDASYPEGCSLIKSGVHRAVYRIASASGNYYLKHYRSPDWKSAIRNRLLGSQAERESKAITSAKKSGITTPEISALGMITDPHTANESLLLTGEIKNAVPLDELLDSVTLFSLDVKKKLIRSLAEIVSEMISAGHRHRDFHAGNLIVDLSSPNSPKVTLIDLQSWKIKSNQKDIEKQLLGTLYHSIVLQTSQTDRFRFLHSLHKQLDRDGISFREWFKSISQSSDQIRSKLLAKQDRKWARGNRRLRILRTEFFESRCIAEIESRFLNSIAEKPEQLFEPQCVQRWFKQSDSGRVAAIEFSIHDQKIAAYYKQVKPKTGLRGMLAGFRTSSVRKAWETGHAFLRRGLPTPKPLLFCEPKNRNKNSEFLLTESIPDSIVLSAYYEAYIDEMSGPAANDWINRYATASAKVVREMHDYDFDHRDLKSNNLLVSENRNDTKLWILDLDSVQKWSRIPSSRRIQNLSRLCQSSFDNSRVRATHRLRFLKKYLGSDFKSHWKQYWRQIDQRIQKRNRKKNSSNSLSAHLKMLFLLLVVVFSLGLSGCTIFRSPAVGLPNKHSIRSDQLLVQSDFKLPRDHKLIVELSKLRKDVASILDIKTKDREVVVYLFSDPKQYSKYLDSMYPGLPPRRAYFVGTPDELAVYAVWGERIQEDLRHEYTHGLLHAALKSVPLWLDEGLAEYFEVAGDVPGGLNPVSIRRLTQAYKNGWKPDMNRLELLETVGEMQRMDYQEAWAWVHFMLNENESTRKVLLSYLQDLNTGYTPTPISERLRLVMPDVENRLIGYLSKLQVRARNETIVRSKILPQ